MRYDGRVWLLLFATSSATLLLNESFLGIFAAYVIFFTLAAEPAPAALRRSVHDA